MDAATVPAKRGIQDRAEPDGPRQAGHTRHVVTEKCGIPRAEMSSAANVNETTLLEHLIDAIPPIPGKVG